MAGPVSGAATRNAGASPVRKGPLRRTPDQLLAADPGRHVWVSASAGTGKTQVLTDRMLRLMLAGAAPDRILALTYTRAAAAEMQNRVTARLGGWMTLDDAALAAELEALGCAPSLRMLGRARSLFALALDVPGGLKVQTIHAFAQGLLAAFPLEAGLPPGFTALDERDSRQLRQQALAEAITEAQRAGDVAWLEDLAELSVMKGEGGVMQALGCMIAHAEGMEALPAGPGIALAVRQLLGVPPDAMPGDARREGAAPGGPLDPLLAGIAEAMEHWGAKTGLAIADAARTWLKADARQRIDAWDMARGVVLKKDGAPLKHGHAVKKDPALQGLLDAAVAHVLAIEDAERRLLAADIGARALRGGARVVARYQRLKRAAVAIDYDDMIARTARLLGPAGLPNYVGWKLDSRFDHVLVDEAQDTNARQWAIIGRLVEDYFDSASERHRSLFVVGDHKQAIYGFQGTDPELFEAEAKRIVPLAEAAGSPLALVPLDRSFRSGPAVLDFVNAFIDAVTPAALGMTGAQAPHLSSRAEAPGEVVLWPALTPPETEAGGDDGEAAGDDAEDVGDSGAEAADRRMARVLASQIAAWLEPGNPERLWLPAHGRHANAGDILVLVRKRSQLMGGLVAALHGEGVPVAGVDRLLLTEPYAVLDLLALVRFAVQPEDDLNLACLLVSPFLGWTHEAVRALSGNRPADLWAALGRAAAGGGAAAEARALLNTVLALADTAGPYDFLDTILSGPIRGRRRLLERLGPEAGDPIDELLSQALAYEVRHPPSLAAFLAWVEADGSDVKRDADGPSDKVRLMTVHGAKGLEAPVVVLADTAHQRQKSRDGWLPVRLPGASGDVPLFHARTADMPEALIALRDRRDARAAEEDLRLLYVALTRAADHLYIGGAVGPRGATVLGTDKDESWYGRLRPMFDSLPGAEPAGCAAWAEWGTALRIRRGEWAAPRNPAVADVRAEGSGHAIRDDVVVTPAPPPARPPRPLTPSAMPDAPATGPATPALRDAARRGRLLHRLFERLPDVAPDRREAVALGWLQGQGATAAEAAAMFAEAQVILSMPALQPLFGPRSLAEAPVAGLVGDQVIAGTVDRLLVEDDRILVLDFKTGLSIPADENAVPLAYRRQMAAYCAVLRQAFPGRRVEAQLLYTAGPRLFILEAAGLEGLLPLD